MTDPESTTTRRDLLGILLSRFERGVITDRERPLLRPLVEAEMAPDAAMIEAKAEYDELQQRHDDLIAETRRQGDVHERTAQRAKQAEEAIARVRMAITSKVMYGPDALEAVPVDRLRAALDDPTPATSATDGGQR